MCVTNLSSLVKFFGFFSIFFSQKQINLRKKWHSMYTNIQVNYSSWFWSSTHLICRIFFWALIFKNWMKLNKIFKNFKCVLLPITRCSQKLKQYLNRFYLLLDILIFRYFYFLHCRVLYMSSLINWSIEPSLIIR